MQLHRLADIHSPVRRVRFAGVGLAMLGAVGLGLTAVPACGGGGSTGENVVHQRDAAAQTTVILADGGVAPDCGGGGATGDD